MKRRNSLFSSVLALLLCVSMLLGTTFAWFTDSATSGNNVVQSGKLDVEMYWSDSLLAADSDQWQDADGTPIFTYDKWEPGYTEVRYIKVKNAGNLSLQWRLFIEAEGAVGELAEVIDVYYINPVTSTVTTLQGQTSAGALKDVIQNHTSANGVLLPAGETSATHTVGETILAVAFHMDEEAGNEYQGKSVGDGFSVSLIATQFAYESDSFGDKYDENAQWPNNVVVGGTSASAAVTPDANNKVSSAVAVNSTDGKIGATVPAGVKLAAGTNKLTLKVSDVADSKANITLSETEASLSIDVHIDGVAEDNDVVMAVAIKELLPVGLNMGNHRFYHVEDGQTVEMTLLADGATPVHNNYEYDPVTGDVVLHLKSFSELAMVADTENAWEGSFDYSWYDANATELTIANADQLAAFGAIVGGMRTITGINDEGKYTYSVEVIQDSFDGKTVKLLADIDLGDKESENKENLIFYPIGYWNNEGTYERKPVEERKTAVESGFYTFAGTFDGNGHTIANFYQNTWEMKGDHNWYNPITEQYYRDGMGLFGKVYGGTVKNLTVENFSSDGEITTTGVIAAYADGATFENIAIVGCNPRVYNIGNGGIVGCVGWYAKEGGLKTTFTNITVDNSNKISALWGSWDVACGGLVGQYYPTSGQEGSPVNAGIHMENCHVAAQIDVYNDVCANYQYYAYRYAGMLIGSVRENVNGDDGHVYPKMDGITASGCTVHFGDWNDYYYCELVANSLASYTHDHQMSRLEQVEKLNPETKKYLPLGKTDTEGNWVDIPTDGRYNYVVVTEKNDDGTWKHGDGHEFAECYHFVNGKQHFHDVADDDNPNPTEKVDGVEGVLKEDKQLIYREFNQLFTGYSWGVTSKGIGDIEGVTILDREVADSVKKFESFEFVQTLFDSDSEVTIGKLFTALAGVTIDTDNVMVFVSPADSNSTVSGDYTANTENWTQGKLVLTGEGKAIISITDYNYCIITSLEVTVGIEGPSIMDGENNPSVEFG